MLIIQSGDIRFFKQTILLRMNLVNMISRRCYRLDFSIRSAPPIQSMDPTVYGKRIDALRRNIEDAASLD